jgi:hypothetical protein
VTVGQPLPEEFGAVIIDGEFNPDSQGMRFEEAKRFGRVLTRDDGLGLRLTHDLPCARDDQGRAPAERVPRPDVHWTGTRKNALVVPIRTRCPYHHDLVTFADPTTYGVGTTIRSNRTLPG